MRQILLLLCACEPDIKPAPLDSPAPEESAPPGETGLVESVSTESTPPVDTDTAPPPEPHVEEETLPELADPSDWVFNDDEVHLIDITLPSTSADSLAADPYTYVEADLLFDGIVVEDIGVRLKGKIGSFRTLSQKAAFKVDINAFIPGREFYGVKKFNLNNMAVDYSYMKEHLHYKILRDLGLPSLRTGWAWVTVNGEAYGLYNLLEQPDQEFLEHNFADPSGNLYDGKYIWYGGYSYTLLDFSTAVQDLYPLEEGTDVGHADIYAVTEAISTYAGTSDYYSKVGEVVDWDMVLMYLSWEQWIGHNDGYALNTNNNFLYFNPETGGKMVFLPWDLDYSGLYDYSWGMSWTYPRGVLAYYCMWDGGDCYNDWRTHASELVSTLDIASYEAYLADMDALTEPYIADDPRKECGVDDVNYYQFQVLSWLTHRNDYMTAFWGL